MGKTLRCRFQLSLLFAGSDREQADRCGNQIWAGRHRANGCGHSGAQYTDTIWLLKGRRTSRARGSARTSYRYSELFGVHVGSLVGCDCIRRVEYRACAGISGRVDSTKGRQPDRPAADRWQRFLWMDTGPEWQRYALSISDSKRRHAGNTVWAAGTQYKLASAIARVCATRSSAFGARAQTLGFNHPGRQLMR